MLNKINLLSRVNWFLLLLAVFVFSRIPTWLFPYDSDHWIFYYIGKHWFNGSTLYVDVWDHKSPLIFAYNGILSKLFSDNIVLHRIFFTLIAILAIWIFYKTAFLLYKQLKFNNVLALSRLSTLVFALIANLAVFTNSGNNNENIGLVFLLAMLYWYLKWRGQPNQKYQYLLLSGLMASFVFILKANFAILILPIVVDLIILTRKNAYRLISSLCVFALGTLLHLLGWALYFQQTGTFKQFLIAAFEFNSKYMSALGWDMSAPGITVFVGILILLLLFFALFIVRALTTLIKNKNANNLLVSMLGICALIFMILAGTFYSHYFLITLPWLCLVLGATYQIKSKLKPKLILCFLSLVALLLVGASYKQLYNSFFGSVKSEANNQTTVANYIKEHTSSNDKFFAYVYGATFYQLAQRDSGSRYISASHLLIDYKYQFGYNFNQQFIFDMIYSEAKYVVMSSDPDDLYRVENPVAMKFINNNYHPETSIAGYDILIRNNGY